LKLLPEADGVHRARIITGRRKGDMQ
jgi:hypothetical protein